MHVQRKVTLQGAQPTFIINPELLNLRGRCVCTACTLSTSAHSFCSRPALRSARTGGAPCTSMPPESIWVAKPMTGATPCVQADEKEEGEKKGREGKERE
eukprot:scaffold87784_cov19-Tisochrysis_lutea.AAC.3